MHTYNHTRHATHAMHTTTILIDIKHDYIPFALVRPTLGSQLHYALIIVAKQSCILFWIYLETPYIAIEVLLLGSTLGWG